MDNHIHILNGDALAERFPEEIKGQRIVIRECMAICSAYEGSIEDIFKHRAEFLQSRYPEIVEDYYSKVILPEFDKLKRLDTSYKIHLWFENDLFCQANLWFTITYLDYLGLSKNLYLVEPTSQHPYSFAYHSREALHTIFKERKYITNTADYILIWEAFINKNRTVLKKINEQTSHLAILKNALDMAISIIPNEKDQSAFDLKCKKIYNSLSLINFKEFYAIFQSKYPEYGFGDLEMYVRFERLKS